MTPAATIEQTSAAVTTVRFTVDDADWEQWLLLRSDAHHDSPYCNRELEKRQLDLALKRNALIFDNGDCLDAMQGKFDPRRNMDEVRPEDAGADYYDRIVKHAFEFYEPYARLWTEFDDGNHESAVLSNTNHSITTSLVDKMRAAGSPCVHGGFGGWVRFMFTIHGTRKTSMRIKRFHGAGTEAPVTRGVIQTNRQQVYLPDADIVWNGHNHSSYVVPIARERISDKGTVYHDICWHIRTPGYKDAYADGTRGWEVERGGVPKPNGACWVRLTLRRISEKGRDNVIIEAYQDVE